MDLDVIIMIKVEFLSLKFKKENLTIREKLEVFIAVKGMSDKNF